MKKFAIKSIVVMLSLALLVMVSCKKKDNSSSTSSDTTKPSVTILSPTSEATWQSTESPITIAGTASDNEAVAKVTWSDGNGNSGTATGTTQWSADVPLQTGENVITVKAHDAAGNTATAQITISYSEYLTFLSSPFISPNSFYINTQTDVRVSVPIMANPKLDENSVYLIEVDAAGNELSEICQLFDDGDLGNHGDEIRGDGVFSNLTSIMKEEAGNFYFRVKANTEEEIGVVTSQSSNSQVYVVAELDDEMVQEMYNAQTEGNSKFNELSATLPLEQAISQTIDYLNAQSSVASATKTASNDIFITYNTGTKGMIFTGDDSSEGGRGNGNKVPMSRQSRGSYYDMRGMTVDNNTIINRNVLLYAPNYAQFSQWGTEFMDDVVETLEAASCSQFGITYLKNQEADLEALKNLSNYGMIVIHTHGGLDEDGDVIFLTGDEAVVDSDYLLDWITGRLYLVNDTKWAVKPSFISTYNQNLPNSIVYNGSCYSAYNETMSNAFLGSGAQAYFGFSNSVLSTFDRDMANDLFPKLIEENKTTGEAFVANQHDTNNPPAYFVMKGNTQLKFRYGFVNGNFEEGTLDGYITAGDGRIISQLAYITPYEGNYMGIISTGLGYTEAMGSIAQSFCLPDKNDIHMTFNWNFLSEEFMEWVGSIYMDYFRVYVIDEYGEVHTVFSKCIDQIAAEYDLTYVSPEIVFDRGDVYGTGWLGLDIDLSEFAGQHVTIRFASEDVGDSIYDTVILLDNIVID